MKHLKSSQSFCRQKAMRLAMLSASLLIVLSAWGQDVNLNEAHGIAMDFFKSHGVNSEATLQKSARFKAPEKTGANSPYYIFNSSDDKAFVVVSGDSRTQKVLAYSTDGAFDEADIAPGAAYMLEQYEEYISSLQNPANAQTTKANVSFGSGKLIETALWNQNPSPWWDYCPVYEGKNTYAGCVAVAMSILMRHYEWPIKGFGSKSYTTKTLGLNLSANFEEFDYNWTTLPKSKLTSYSTDWNAANKTIVAKVLNQCGVAANMDYNTDESIASLTDEAVALYRYFGYTLCDYIAKDNVSEDEWYSTIKEEIDNNSPILYEGRTGKNSGHAFICDGYDSNGYLHFNFGWSGSGNGYYEILSSNMTYRNNQGINVGIRPDYNASTRTLADFQMRIAGKEASNGFEVLGDGIIHRGQTFTAKCYNLLNTTDQNVSCNVALFVCDENGSPKMKLGEYPSLKFDASSCYSWLTFGCGIPYDYTVLDTDHLALFSSTDEGNTWKQVECTDPTIARIRLADIYDATVNHLEMVSDSRYEGFGLTIKAGSLVNVKGQGFYVTANCLKNTLSQTFAGDVAAFICDKNGVQKFQIGNSTISELKSHYFIPELNISCTIPKGSDVEVGDRIMVFSKLNGEETWARIACADATKEYIEITEESITATPPQLRMVSADGYPVGLNVKEGDAINFDGTAFSVGAYKLANIMSSSFSGEVAIFLCDKNGTRKQKIGTSTIPELGARYAYTKPYDVSCKITSDIEVSPGDRLCMFTKMHDDDTWVFVDCVEPEKSHIVVLELSSTDGDVNGDGEINITDLNLIIDIISENIYSENADINWDNEVNITDLNMVIDIMSNK